MALGQNIVIPSDYIGAIVLLIFICYGLLTIGIYCVWEFIDKIRHNRHKK